MIIDPNELTDREKRVIEMSAKLILRHLGFRDAQHVQQVLAANGCYKIGGLE